MDMLQGLALDLQRTVRARPLLASPDKSSHWPYRKSDQAGQVMAKALLADSNPVTVCMGFLLRAVTTGKGMKWLGRVYLRTNHETRYAPRMLSGL